MPSVALRFTPPDRENLVSLRVYEATSASGPWGVPIEITTEIGSYPDYIDQFTTDQANSLVNWFAISWVDDKGAETELSNPIQGGVTTFIGEMVQLVGERDNSLDSQVVRQEAEAAIESYFGGADPYTVDGSTVSYTIKVGLARLIQARSMLNELITVTASGSSAGWTAGLVSMKSGTEQTKQSESLIKYLLQQAMVALGIGTSRIAQMAVPAIAGGLSEIVSADISRLLIEVE